MRITQRHLRRLLLLVVRRPSSCSVSKQKEDGSAEESNWEKKLDLSNRLTKESTNGWVKHQRKKPSEGLFARSLRCSSFTQSLSNYKVGSLT